MKKKEKITNGTLLYHPVHGLCRVERVLPPDPYGPKCPSYSLVPKISAKMKSRFVISAGDLEMSGFHALVSPREANKILLFLKSSRNKKNSRNGLPRDQAWGLAQAIASFAHEKFEAKDQRKRQALEHSAKGLVGELSCVYKYSLKKTADRIIKSLGRVSLVNPSVISALTLAGED